MFFLCLIDLQETVTREDVAEALRLVRVAIQQAAMEPRTGTIDMDLITTGRSASARVQLAALTKELRHVISSSDKISFKFESLLGTMREQSTVEISGEQLLEAVRKLAEEEFVVLSGPQNNPMIQKT
jgi:DNA replication licensing factor MCM4